MVKCYLYSGDCRDSLRRIRADSMDTCVTDPPYHLTTGKRGGSGLASYNLNSPAGRARIGTGFMGKQWDGGDVAFDPATWAAVLRVLKPGGHMFVFGGTRTHHRMVCAIEDAGFEIRDTLMWLYGKGFPKSLDVSKAIDREAGAVRDKVRYGNPRNPKATSGGKDGMVGATRPWIEEAMRVVYHELDSDVPITPEVAQWQGWGTALKPSFEPIVLARKPLIGTVAANVLRWGTGAINIDGCRVGTDGGTKGYRGARNAIAPIAAGRWPANVIHDGSPEVLAGFPMQTLSGGKANGGQRGRRPGGFGNVGADKGDTRPNGPTYADQGSAARFFYTAKADKVDRTDTKHPTVKPVDLMRWLCKLVTPSGGMILDPFAGSGTTGVAAISEQFNAVLMEQDATYVSDIRKRLRHYCVVR